MIFKKNHFLSSDKLNLVFAFSVNISNSLIFFNVTFLLLILFIHSLIQSLFLSLFLSLSKLASFAVSLSPSKHHVIVCSLFLRLQQPKYSHICIIIDFVCPSFLRLRGKHEMPSIIIRFFLTIRFSFFLFFSFHSYLVSHLIYWTLRHLGNADINKQTNKQRNK